MNEIKHGTIAVATDGSANAGMAIQWATEQAYLERRQLAVVSAACAAYSPMPVFAGAGNGVVPIVAREDLLASATAVAEDGADLARQHRPGLTVSAIALPGEPRAVLTDLSADAHMIVIGSRGRGAVSSRLLGSMSASVAKHASCPVVVVRPGRRLATQHGILVGADGTEQSVPVIEFAFQQASLHGQPLTVMHCVWDIVAAMEGPSLIHDNEHDDEARLLAESIAGFAERYPEVDIDLQLARGFADTCLAADSQRWRLLVVGRHQAESLSRLATPSVATSVIEHSRTCVAVIPQESA